MRVVGYKLFQMFGLGAYLWFIANVTMTRNLLRWNVKFKMTQKLWELKFIGYERFPSELHHLSPSILIQSFHGHQFVLKLGISRTKEFSSRTNSWADEWLTFRVLNWVIGLFAYAITNYSLQAKNSTIDVKLFVINLCFWATVTQTL